jgi:hypothetical protein
MTAKAPVRYHIAAGSAINERATSGKYLTDVTQSAIDD